ncbi:MAG: hypothetical protein NWF09_07695 [Candidatus Bathyarchaeota archaeon]|nr:hypothetical protein [Candidatus Bathyarchaeota archaeon]
MAQISRDIYLSVKDTIETVKDKLAENGIYVGKIDVVYNNIGNGVITVMFKNVSIDLENKNLRKDLAEVSSNWRNFFNVLNLKCLIDGSALQIEDFIEVSEIYWNQREGAQVILNYDLQIYDFMKEFGFDIDLEEMSKALESILNYEARQVLHKLRSCVSPF